MNGLKGRVNKLIHEKFVYFSYGDLVFIRDYLKRYLDDQSADLTDYEAQCKELEACLEQYVKNKSCDYPAQLRDLSENHLLAHYAYLYRMYERICDSHPSGWWIWEGSMADPVMHNLRIAKAYFKDKSKGGN